MGRVSKRFCSGKCQSLKMRVELRHAPLGAGPVNMDMGRASTRPFRCRANQGGYGVCFDTARSGLGRPRRTRAKLRRGFFGADPVKDNMAGQNLDAGRASTRPFRGRSNHRLNFDTACSGLGRPRQTRPISGPSQPKRIWVEFRRCPFGPGPVKKDMC
jgi:hypothetical protein